MKRYVWVLGALFIIVLLVAAEIAVISNATGYDKKEKVVFSRVKINKNTVIESDMLELREISSEAVHPEALKNVNAAELKIAAIDIEAGEMMLKAKLSSGIRGIIEAEDKNKRLFSVEFEGDQANGWQLADGQYVDIIFVPDENGVANQSSGTDGMELAAVYRNRVKVLEKIRIAGIINEDGKLADISDKQGLPRYISFEVTGEQAEFLAFAKKNGRIEISSIPGN